LKHKTNIKKYRIQEGYTLSQVANALGCSISGYAKYESGDREPSIKTLFALADFYGISIDELLGHEVVASHDDIVWDDGELTEEDYKIDESIAGIIKAGMEKWQKKGGKKGSKEDSEGSKKGSKEGSKEDSEDREESKYDVFVELATAEEVKNKGLPEGKYSRGFMDWFDSLPDGDGEDEEDTAWLEAYNEDLGVSNDYPFKEKKTDGNKIHNKKKINFS